MFSPITLSRHLIARACCRSKHTLPAMPYDYKALEPIVNREIMEIHHTKHHQTYITNLNAAEAQLAEAVSKNDVSKIIALQPALRFNGGGHLNHSIFWQNLSPNSSKPSASLTNAISAEFGSLEEFKTKFAASTVAIQGSGWGWLALNPAAKRLQIIACANQDPLQATTGLIPLLGFDVWEHAYYLQYKNARADYVKALWDVVNWQDVSDRYMSASSA